MEQDKIMRDILEAVVFLKDHAVTREELVDQIVGLKGDLLAQMETLVEERLTSVKDEILTHVDSFIVLHQKLDTEFVALRAKYDRLEGHLQQIAAHLQLRLG